VIRCRCLHTVVQCDRTLGAAIKAVMHGAAWIDPAITSRVLQSSVQAIGADLPSGESVARKSGIFKAGLLSSVMMKPAVVDQISPELKVKEGASNERLDHSDFLQ